MIQAKMAEMKNINVSLINTWTLNFPGGPVVKTPPSSAWGVGSIPGLGTKIPHAVQRSQKFFFNFLKNYWGKENLLII